MAYKTDLTDAQWDLIKDYFAPESMGAPRKYEIRNVFNALIYMLRTGCQWRLLPNDFPPYKTVQYYFYRWIKTGVIQKMQQHLHGDLRELLGRNRKPSLGMIDSQSVKTVQKGADIGLDGGKKVKGRKRHIVVDVTGHLLEAQVHSAQVHDSTGAYSVLAECLVQENFEAIKKVLADTGYRGDLGEWFQDLAEQITGKKRR
jgi:putative transposase